MPDGDLLTLDYQWQLVDTLFGRGAGDTWLQQMGQSIEGLGAPDVKTQDVPYAGRDGSAGNPDFNDVRLITIPAMIRSATPEDATTAFAALQSAWAPVAADVDLTFQLPGPVKPEVHGRPRGFTEDFSLVYRGVIKVLLRFDCLDPTLTYL